MIRLKKNFILVITVAFILAVLAAGCGQPKKSQEPAPEIKDVILATTTSTVDSGLLDELIPVFEKKTGYNVKTIAVGTGKALAMGEKGEADVLLVHAPKSEQPLVDSGAAVNYQLVMHNDFLIVGPANDLAQVKGLKDSALALQKIAQEKCIFVSRGDNSGTHKKEKSIWQKAGLVPSGNWYHESGTGMAQTLQITSEKQGYTLTDRATYLNLKQNLKLVPLVEGDPILLNIYHVMQVNPEKFSKVNEEGAKAFVGFMISPETQKMIGDFGKKKFGQPLFIPDAGKKMEELTV